MHRRWQDDHDRRTRFGSTMRGRCEDETGARRGGKGSRERNAGRKNRKRQERAGRFHPGGDIILSFGRNAAAVRDRRQCSYLYKTRSRHNSNFLLLHGERWGRRARAREHAREKARERNAAKEDFHRRGISAPPSANHEASSGRIARIARDFRRRSSNVVRDDSSLIGCGPGKMEIPKAPRRTRYPLFRAIAYAFAA